jgi:hypothetical protein
VSEVCHWVNIHHGRNNAENEPPDEKLHCPMVDDITEAIVPRREDPEQSEEAITHSGQADTTAGECKFNRTRPDCEQDDEGCSPKVSENLLHDRSEDPDPVDIEDEMQNVCMREDTGKEAPEFSAANHYSFEQR